MSLLFTMYAHSKVRKLINEAHAEREKNGPPITLTDLLMNAFRAQVMKKVEEALTPQPSTTKED